MRWREWRFWDYILVSRVEQDPDFRDELTSLASRGLLAIGAVCIGAPLFAMLAGVLGVPEMLEPSALLAIYSILALGVVAIPLSRWGPAQPVSNLIGIGVGYLVGVSQLWASLTASEGEVGSVHHIPGNVSMIMLVGIAALPDASLTDDVPGIDAARELLDTSPVGRPNHRHELPSNPLGVSGVLGPVKKGTKANGSKIPQGEEWTHR